MVEYDVKITKQTNWLNGDTWFELFEIESGEILHEGNTYDECLDAFNLLDHSKYELLNN